MNKYDKYNEIKEGLISEGIQVGEIKEINFGLQFDVNMNGNISKVRIYESKKKGITVDLSQVKYEALKNVIENINNTKACTRKVDETQSKLIQNTSPSNFLSDQLETPLIGVDESGKGDYFGPLVIAGVYADKQTKLLLEALGAMDSKALNDKQIRSLAIQIRQICKCETVVIGNESYNKIYERVGNLNKLLAWGHARVIENLLGRVECSCALSDQFGNESLIKDALMEKGKEITLEQRPRAEQNIVVAAASIIARDEFVTKIEQMEMSYNQKFPKGASTATVNAAKVFAKTYGKERMNEVSKLHFKTTQNI
ncbi:MAG: ribonuclease HIII [Cellulosilyticaceae bacterium]